MLFEANVWLFLSVNHFLFLDCIAPYNVEIDFDAVSDEDANAVNTKSSCGKFMLN